MSRRDRHPYPFHVGATCAPQIIASLPRRAPRSPWPIIAWALGISAAVAFILHHVA